MALIARVVLDYLTLSLIWCRETLKAALHAAALAVKHTVLDYAHPLPTCVCLTCRAGGVEVHVLQAVMEATRFAGMEVVLSETENTGRPSMQIVGGETSGDGTMAIVRYLGRVSRKYSTRPELAFQMDRQLDAFKSLLDTMDAWQEARGPFPEVTVIEALAVAEEGLGQGAFMAGFEDTSVVDACWIGMLEWLMKKDLYTRDSLSTDFPQVHDWWKMYALTSAKRDSSSDSSSDSGD